MKKNAAVDLSEFSAASVNEYTTLVCLACIFDIFTVQLGLAPRTAYSEIKRYLPSIEELTAPKAARPFFDSDDKNPHCPYCNAAKRWHARLDTLRIEGGKSTDSARKKLIAALPRKDEQFRIVEVKTEKRKVFFDWLATLDHILDLDDAAWFLETTRLFLERLEPKVNWQENLLGVRRVKCSKQLEQGWECSGSVLFLSPAIYNQLIMVQYMVSRSHKHGGRTLAGRLTLMELIRRLRYSGYLANEGIIEVDQFEILEKVIEKLAGGQGKVTLYYVIDRRQFLKKVKSVYAHYAN